MDYFKKNSHISVASNLTPLQSIDITGKVKHILKKPSHLRTQFELDYLKQIALQLKCFWPYSYTIRHQLIKVLYYQLFRTGDIIDTSEGGLYYIITGSVRIITPDPSNRGATTIQSQLGPGCTLDQEKIKRIFKATCEMYTELLYVSKYDLELVIKMDRDITWSLKMNLLCTHPTFSEWTDTALTAITEASSFVKYSPNSVIIRDLSKMSDFVYLMVQGSCHVVQKLKMREVQDYEQKRLHFIMPFTEKYKGVIVRKWVSLYIIQPGDIFGIGEGNIDTCVVSKHFVKCLAINKHVLLKYDRYGKITTLRDGIMKILPSIDTVFGKFIEQCQWNEYKKNVHAKLMSKEGTLFKLPPIVKTTGKYFDSSMKKCDI